MERISEVSSARAAILFEGAYHLCGDGLQRSRFAGITHRRRLLAAGVQLVEHAKCTYSICAALQHDAQHSHSLRMQLNHVRKCQF